MYVPSPRAENVPRQYGVPVQRIADFDANGPKSATLTVTATAPKPSTITLSVIRAPGFVVWSLILVRT